MPGLRGPRTIELVIQMALLVPLLALGLPPRDGSPLPARAAQRATPAGDQPVPLQIIAAGTGAIPTGNPELVWRVDRGTILGDRRTDVAAFPLGFALALRGPLALLDAEGARLAELTPGRAAFLPAGEPGAFASASGDLALYLQIALVPATAVAADSSPETHATLPFPAPGSDMLSLELARGIINPGQATDLPGNDPPALLLAGDSAIHVEADPGDSRVLANGEMALLADAATIRNPGRQPATFIVVRASSLSETSLPASAATASRPRTHPALDDAWERNGCHLNPGNPACLTVTLAVGCAADPAAAGCDIDNDADGCSDVAEVGTGFDPFDPADCLGSGGEPVLNCLFVQGVPLRSGGVASLRGCRG